MRALRVHEHGGPEALRLDSLSTPEPGPGQVRVAVRFVGVNHLDTWVRRGVPGHKFPLPIVLGSDVAGVVDAVGAGVDVQIGARVALHPSLGCGACPRCEEDRDDLCPKFAIRGESFDGGCAEYVVVDQSLVLPVPDDIALDVAAATPLTLLTAWHMLVGRARIRAGQTVLVQAVGSGVGSMAIQIAKFHGCTVLGTASTEEKREKARALGADHVFAYEATKEQVRALAPKGVDIVVDHVGEATWKDSLRALAWGGTLVTCGATSGPKVGLDLRAVFFKQLSVLGCTMGSGKEMLEAWAAFQAGHIRPVIHRVVSMRSAAEAHAALEERAVFGKIVLEQDLGGA